MQLSLLNRFQGALLGAWLGASWDKANHKLFFTDEQLLPWINLAIAITERIIDSGQISEDDWPEIFEQQIDTLNLKKPISSAMIALATLPLTLFFHDNPHQFQEYLYSLNKIWQQSPETLEEVMFWSDAIALILREKLKIGSFIPQLLERHSNTATFLGQQLKQVQTFLEEKIPLQQAVSQLSRCEQFHPHEIALACYCFAYTPQEFSLCVKRAKHIYWGAERVPHYQPSLTATLTGIMAGVYNGVSGIPIAWLLPVENVKILEKTYQQATNLLAVWSGVNQPKSLQPLQYSAIASPFIIQPRLNFKMSSQKEV